MFDFFKSGNASDTKTIRNAILQFVKEHLQKAEGGEGNNIRGLCLYLTCNASQRHLYEAAIYTDEPERFKDEVQKIADDYAIDLPLTWTIETSFVEDPPVEALQAKDVDAALFISTKKKPKIQASEVAYIRVLNGEAEQPLYTLKAGTGKINIGRDKKTQTADGFYRENTIAFLSDSSHTSNRSVSRQHGHIEWDNDAAAFYVYADEGGIPPYNKLKVRTEGGTPVKLQTIQIGHRLREGDQLVIGESALLEFTLTNEEN